MRVPRRPWNWLVPALLVAVAVVAVAVAWNVPSIYGDWLAPRPAATGVTGQPTATPAAAILSTPSATGPRPPATVPTLLPGPSPTFSRGTSTSTPSAPPVDTPGAVASRIRIESFNVDLPIVSGTLVVPGNRDLYPLCDVAMILDGFVAPGVPGTTYLYAHAQQGMFLPLLRASEIDDGAAMIGARVEIFSADGRVHVYEIVRVKRHATDLSLAAVAPGEHQLVLQTSEGPTGTVPKLQIAARPVTIADVPPEEANPVPQPRVCLPG